MTQPAKKARPLELKRYFAKRVTDQARHVLSIWRLVNQEYWPPQRVNDLIHATQKLVRYAEHFEETSHLKIATEITGLLQEVDTQQGPPSSHLLSQLSQQVQRLSQTAVRRSDLKHSLIPVITPQKPIYVAINDEELANKILQQLEFFSFRAERCASVEQFHQMMKQRYPAAMIMDVQFGNEERRGIDLLTQIQRGLDSPIPTIFYSNQTHDIETRLKASRAGGCYFHSRNADLSLVIEQVQKLTELTPATPYRVLIIEDSKLQAKQIEQIINNAGLLTRAVLNPLEVLPALEEFQPEIILMDMYMPACNGMEVANVIRQQSQYMSVPIVFLSSEQNPDIHIAAMSKGGDDFLTKPVKPKHLIATIKSKGERSRSIAAFVNQDSLTGLLNHTSILRELNKGAQKAMAMQMPLSFAMIDIDHFKNINDTYGHPVGDQVIKNLALFLKQRLRKSDAIGRYGGEEFAAVLPDTTGSDAMKIFEEIRQRFSQMKLSVKGQEFFVTFSCGIAQLTPENYKELCIIADENLYNAKHLGRNRVCYTDSPHSS